LKQKGPPPIRTLLAYRNWGTGVIAREKIAQTPVKKKKKKKLKQRGQIQKLGGACLSNIPSGN